jgi:predicted dehydrogenase
MKDEKDRMKRLRVAVVGVGHLGKEHARILASLPEVELVGVVDPNRVQAEAVAQRCGTRAFSDHRLLLGEVRAAVVAAPTVYHHTVARDFLAAGVPLLVEKPLAGNLAQADELARLSAEQGTLVQVGHIERFNPAFEELQNHPIRPRYIAAERCSGFSGRSTDVGVVLDVMIHDIDLVLTLVRSPAVRVEAMGAAVLGGNEDLAQARVTFANGCVADLTASRVHPESVRRMRLWGAEGYAGVDFASRKLTLMQPGEHLRRGRIDSRRLDPAILASLKTELFTRHLHATDVDCSGRHQADQLTRELQEFVRCARIGGAPRADAAAGRDALALASQILDRIRVHAWEGRPDGPIGPHQLPAPHGWLFHLENAPPAEAA